MHTRVDTTPYRLTAEDRAAGYTETFCGYALNGREAQALELPTGYYVHELAKDRVNADNFVRYAGHYDQSFYARRESVRSYVNSLVTMLEERVNACGRPEVVAYYEHSLAMYRRALTAADAMADQIRG